MCMFNRNRTRRRSNWLIDTKWLLSVLDAYQYLWIVVRGQTSNSIYSNWLEMDNMLLKTDIIEMPHNSYLTLAAFILQKPPTQYTSPYYKKRHSCFFCLLTYIWNFRRSVKPMKSNGKFEHTYTSDIHEVGKILGCMKRKKRLRKFLSDVERLMRNKENRWMVYFIWIRYRSGIFQIVRNWIR